MRRLAHTSGLFVYSISSIPYPHSAMAPKKRSQTPRHSGAAEPTSPILSQQSSPTLLADPSNQHYRRRSRDSPRNLSSAQLPTPDTVASTRSPIVPDSPHSTVEDSHSRRESISTMRTSSISLEGPSTCTPTGRISKAKKGKRVHACEFPGCGKVSLTMQQAPNLRPSTQIMSECLANIQEGFY